MGSVRVYDNKIKDWVVVNTSDASSISVRSEKLLPEGIETTNIEDVLVTMKDNIDTLKSNVSWLAKHGGGGSGGGSGGGYLSAELFVNNYPTGSDVILQDTLTIKVQANQTSALWDITVVGLNKIIKSINNTNQLIITKEDIKKAGIDKTFQLSITAVNNESFSSAYWNGTIYIANVELQTNGTNNTFDNYQNSNLELAYNYKIGVTGNYKLVVNEQEVWRGALNYNEGILSVPLKNLPELFPGANTIESQLIKVDDENVYSPISTAQIVLTSDDPVITCLNFSQDPDNPTEYTVNESGQTILPIKYAVYFTSGSYKAIISEEEASDFSNILTYNDYNVVYSGSYAIETKGDFTFTISILDTIRNTVYSKEFYVRTKDPEYKLLDNGKKENLIFDFNSFNGDIKNGVWTDSKNNTITIKNINQYSETIKEDKIMRFQNASYGVLQRPGNIPIASEIIGRDNWDFTLSIQYKADFHPDDDRTILQFGHLYGEDKGYTPQTGILIKAHNLYIGSNFLDLQDRELTNITITYMNAPDDPMGTAFVYLDGVVEKVYKINKSTILPSDKNTIYLAAQNYDNKSMFYADTNIYRVMFYNTCLNPYEVIQDCLNNEAYVNHVNGQPNSQYIINGLKRNFIKDNKGERTSLLWNTAERFDNNADQFFDCFDLGKLISTDGNNVGFIPNIISDYSIPIPMMLIDVSQDSSWTWENFITPQSTLKKVVNCPFQYFDQSQNNSNIIKGNVWVDLQGTSTLADMIKNLNIGFDNSIFIPKNTWFPENVYTLKADIVDSSHALNTSIGKFVNTEFGFKYNNDGSLQSTESWYPFSETVRSSYIYEKQNSNSATSKYFPKATLKHGIEGFPIFLIIRFYNPNSSELIIRSLGIYQFILGRDSARNLGYEIIKEVKGIDEEITYPYYKSEVQLTIESNKGYWIEMGQNDSFADGFGFQEMDESTFTNSEKSKFTGAFWQSDDSDGIFYDTIAEIKYHNFGNDAVNSLRNLEPFTNFVNNIKGLPVTNRRYSKEGSKTLERNTFAGNVKYAKYKYIDNGTTKDWQKVDGNNVLLETGDPLNGALGQLNIESIGKYFVIAMFLGLIDNFQKNMPIKLFQKKNSTEFEPPILGIYDTDTGCGGTNEGDIKVSEDVWICLFKNVDLQLLETSESSQDGKVHQIIGNSNKLWYIDSGELNYSLFGGDDRSGSIFAGYWNSFVEYFKTKYGIESLEGLADKFINDYFIPQTQGCGEVLFNLTYFCKYLNKYKSNSDSAPTNQFSKLHGRRIKQIRNWLRNRVQFLDSMFCAMGTPATMTVRQSTAPTVNISSGSAPKFAITTNYPVISKVDSQGSMGRFVYCTKNTNTEIYWGATEPSQQAVSHTISYSDSIQKLGSKDYMLADIKYQKIIDGSLSYLTNFDISNCSTVETMNADGLNVFKSSGISELRNINCENTAKLTTSILFILNLIKGFEKLQSINIYNSCVSQIYLPTDPNIPLLELKVAGAQLTELSLESQNLLTEIDLTNCNKLGSLSIKNCEKLDHLNLDSTQSYLSTVNISSDGFKEFTCNSNKAITNITITSTQLEKVYINNCPKLTSVIVSGQSIKELVISECSNLTTLIITGDITNTLDKLDLSTTGLTSITYNNQTSEIMDLSRFTQIGEFNISGNSKVEYIQFNNDNPISIKKTFQGCTNLKRVYGYLDIQCSSVFYGCTNFSIHGSENITYLGKSVLNGERYLHPEEISGITENGKMKFQSGTGVTNLMFSTTSAHSSFRNTNCSLFDIYYVFYNLGNLTDFSWAFAGLKTSKFEWTETIDNSPNVKLFKNGANITNLAGCFRDGTTKPCKILSPSHSGDTVTADDGLFSPLINCTNISTIFYGSQVYTDRFVFRRKSGNYKLTDIGYFYPNIFSDNVKTLTFAATTNPLNIDRDTAGNFRDFFVNLPNLTNIHAFGDDVYYINYDLTCEGTGLHIPTGVESVTAVLRTRYATGIINIDRLFANSNKVKNIYHSFIVKNAWPTSLIDPAQFKITSNTFKFFTSLERIGFRSSGDNAGTLQLCSFNGAGLKKIIDQTEFPYDILEPCKNTIVEFRGFFQDVSSEKITGPIKLPDTLFSSTTKIQQVGATFRNFQIPYTLTSESFANCPNLLEASYLFAADGISSSCLQGSIPQKLFYHGFTSKTVGGTYVNVDYPANEISEYVNDKPVYRIDKEIADGTIETKEVPLKTINVPLNRIQNLDYCFANSNTDAYINSNPTVEYNPDYHPGNCKQGNNVWNTVVKNENETTYIWEYDGFNTLETGENLDDPHATTTAIVNPFNKGNTGTLNFICAPDLLRYCTTTASIVGLFANSGHTSNSSLTHTNHSDNGKYGIKGRIPPYLLKPVSGITSIKEIFKNCKQLSYYTTEGGTTYLIPVTFFHYTPRLTDLNSAFYGLIFPPNISLDVFKSGANNRQGLDVTQIFMYPKFITAPGERTKIGAIFGKPIFINALTKAFAVNNSSSGQDNNNMVREQNITFDTVFEQFSSGADIQVFDGYRAENVIFENKTLREQTTYNNYRTSNETNI